MKKIVALLPAGRLFETLLSGGIRPVCEQLKLELHQPPIALQKQAAVEPLFRMLRDADLVLADVSAANSSVLFLAGFAQALGKPALYCSVAAEGFPLDYQALSPIIHAGQPEILATELRARLKQWLAPSAAVPSGDASAPGDPQAVIRQEFESIFADILKQHHHRHSGPIFKENENTFVLENNDMELALVQDLARHARSLNLRLKLL